MSGSVGGMAQTSRSSPAIGGAVPTQYKEWGQVNIAPAIGRIELARLGPMHVQAFESQFAKTVAAATVNLAHTILSGTLKYPAHGASAAQLGHAGDAAARSPPRRGAGAFVGRRPPAT